jgi:uncharacterized protein YggE
MFNRLVKFSVGLLAACGILALLSTGLTTLHPAQAATNTDLRTITVSGEAQINVPPDQAVLTLGIATHANDFDAAKQENDNRLLDVLNVLKALEVPADQIHTEYISVFPNYYWTGTHYQYQVVKTLQVTIKDISKFDAILSLTIRSGATDVRKVEFLTTELRKYKDQARSEAIRAAREKAIALTGELGQKIGNPLTIVEDQIYSYSYYSLWNWWGGYQSSSSSANVVQNVSQAPSANGGGAGNTDASAAPGKIAVTAKITVVFEITN